MLTLGAKLIEARKARNWTQKDLATASGVRQSDISKLERGRRKRPAFSTIEKIATALNIPLADLAA